LILVKNMVLVYLIEKSGSISSLPYVLYHLIIRSISLNIALHGNKVTICICETLQESRSLCVHQLVQ
jgi:hypothetical protein